MNSISPITLECQAEPAIMPAIAETPEPVYQRIENPQPSQPSGMIYEPFLEHVTAPTFSKQWGYLFKWNHDSCTRDMYLFVHRQVLDLQMEEIRNRPVMMNHNGPYEGGLTAYDAKLRRDYDAKHNLCDERRGL